MAPHRADDVVAAPASGPSSSVGGREPAPNGARPATRPSYAGRGGAAITTFVLVPGAGGQAWYWHRVVPLLRARGHAAVAVDLPSADEHARLDDYVSAVLDAVPDGMSRAAGAAGLTVVGQSLGALVAPLVAARCGADLLVLVAPMVPRPGETGGDWWEVSGQADAARRFALTQGRDLDEEDEEAVLFHDVPPPVRAEALRRPVAQTGAVFLDPWPLDRWPDVPTRVVAGAADRLFPPDLVVALSRDRAGVEPDLIDKGHLPALADPDALVALLDRYAREVDGS